MIKVILGRLLQLIPILLIILVVTFFISRLVSGARVAQ